MQRCKAKSKRSCQQCKNYALKGSTVCRMHGAKGGPKTLEGRLACKRAALKHGYYTIEAQQKLRELKTTRDSMLSPL